LRIVCISRSQAVAEAQERKLVGRGGRHQNRAASLAAGRGGPDIRSCRVARQRPRDLCPKGELDAGGGRTRARSQGGNSEVLSSARWISARGLVEDQVCRGLHERIQRSSRVRRGGEIIVDRLTFEQIKCVCLGWLKSSFLGATRGPWGLKVVEEVLGGATTFVNYVCSCCCFRFW